MFTGIIECIGEVLHLTHEKSNQVFIIASPISDQLKIDQSIAHDGICLTVVKVENGTHTVVAIQETIQKTSLSHWAKGTKVNLERCMPANGRFDGHIVQGHVDQTAVCTKVEDQDGSWKYWFEYDKSSAQITVSKGSITVNGTSLTVVDSLENSFSVCIIPYTHEHTNFNQIKTGSVVNLEFDIVGKYVAKLMAK